MIDNGDSATVWWYDCDFACIIEGIYCFWLPNISRVPLLSKIQAAADFVPHLPLYYDVRDEILFTPDGQRMTGLYYTHGDEIYSLMENDQSLWNQGLYALEVWEPNLQALVDGQGGAASISAMQVQATTITSGQVQAIDTFLTTLSIYSTTSLSLTQAIADERAHLGDLNNFVGMTMEEARGIVVGYGAYLPIILK